MNRSELLILIALLFGVCHQITDGNPVCPYDSNGTGACDYNTTPCESSPPVVLPTCLARAQSLKIPTVKTIDFRTEVIRHIIPTYVKSYTIVQQNLINFVLTTHLIDRPSMEKLIEQLKTTFANLAPKLGDTVAAGNSISGLVNDAIQQSIASITAGEKTRQEQQKYINEVNTNLTSIQRMIDNATNEVNRESRLPAEAKRTMILAQRIYSRFSGYGGTDGRKLTATEIALARVQCYQYFAKHLQNQNQTLSEHVAKERAALMTLQNTLTELKQKQTTIANITSELTRILLYVSSLNSTSTSLETVVKELGGLEKLITPLNNIYNEILKHHVIEPSAEGQIIHKERKEKKCIG